MKHLLVTFGIIGLALTGCIDGSSDSATDTTTATLTYSPDELARSFPPDMDVVVITQPRDSIYALVQPRQHGRFRGFGRVHGWGFTPQPDSGPCSCDDLVCVQDWVDENLGCNVCAVFVCEDSPNVHGCSQCD